MESTLRAGADAPDLKLIETLGWTGQEFPRLALHMQRLAASAAAFGWACDVRLAEQALRKAAPENAPARLRLTLDAASSIAVEASAMPSPKPNWAIGLSPLTLTSTDPWLRHKTTRRAVYDAARAALPKGWDEAILTNEKGEVCDGTITTLFFDRGQGLRTPPLSAGLLAGVLRADLACPEETLLAQDLPKCRLWVGNSLRGVIPATWQGPALPLS